MNNEAYMADYYRLNKATMNAQSSAYNKEHPEQRKETRKRWRDKTSGNRVHFVRQLVRTARTNARLKEIPFSIDAALIDTWITIQNDKCCLTGFPFEYLKDDQFRARPFAPSIDRKDCSKGYTPDNIQIICNIVNKAKNEYPQEMFDAMCVARVRMINGT